MPEHLALTPTSFEFDEIEACKAFDGDWEKWQAMSPWTRAKLVAHEWEKNMRDGYHRETLERVAEKKAKEAEDKRKGYGSGETSAERISRQMFGSPNI